MSKLKPNDKCHCGSDKKYKKCCFLSDEQERLEENTYVETELMQESMEILKSHFPSIEFKNVSDKLNAKSYITMQVQHMKDNVCLVAEKFKTNEKVFKDRDRKNEEYDLILMYRGAFRTLYLGPSVKMYTLSLKSFFANPSATSLAPNPVEKE